MTSTSEERHHIATKLRVNAERSLCVDRDALRCAIGLEPFVVEDDTTIGEINKNDSETWNRLADLIDVLTTHNIATDKTQSHAPQDFVCECCRYWAAIDPGFRYCPECGERVLK